MPRVKKASNAKQILELDQKVKRKPPQTLKGMRDILPSEQKYWDYVYTKLEELAEIYSFERIDTPILEKSSLFERSVGKDTDIVSKEMYTFSGYGKKKITLRPEMTASIVRAYIEHGMSNVPQPVKLYYEGPVFRHEKPQSGRYRQFHQGGFEVIGENSVAVDVQLILMGYKFFKNLKLDVSVHINSIGCPDCRNEYVKALKKYYKPLKSKLCKTCKDRFNKNPLRLLDCKEKKCQEYQDEAPKFMDHLDEACSFQFNKVLEYLDELKIPYKLNHKMVRGLDYYTRTVFEFVLESKKHKRQNAIAAGGRYDLLVEQLGGKATPAAGFAIGIERVILALKEIEFEPKDEKKIDIFIAQIGDVARRKAMVLFEKLRKKRLKVSENFAKDSLKAQLDYANKEGIRYVLILGQQEVKDKTIIVRDMEGGVQETLKMKGISKELKKMIKKNKKKK